MKPALLDVWEALDLPLPRGSKARCPSPGHEDRHPSCSVYDEHWHCHSCGAGGDVYDLIETVEDLHGFSVLERRAQELAGAGDGVVREVSGPGYLVAGRKGNTRKRRPYVPAWLRR